MAKGPDRAHPTPDASSRRVPPRLAVSGDETGASTDKYYHRPYIRLKIAISSIAAENDVAR